VGLALQGGQESAQVKRTLRNRAREQDMAWNQALIQRRTLDQADRDRWEQLDHPAREALAPGPLPEAAWDQAVLGRVEAAAEDNKAQFTVPGRGRKR
jgi:hypothetical protein